MAKSWSIKNLYLYLVCLVTLFLLVGGAISSISRAVWFFIPDRPNIPIFYTYYPEYRAETNSAFFEPPPLEELEKRRAEQEETDRYYRGYNLRSLLNSVALIIIAAPFYLYHWKRVKPAAGKRGNADEHQVGS